MIRDSFIKTSRETKSPFITNPFRFAGVEWATALTNWLKRKAITINGAAKTATVNDDFSTDNWSHLGENNVSNGVLNWEGERDGTNDSSAYDLGSLDNQWVLRTTLTIDSISTPSSKSHKWFFGISDSDETVGGVSNSDSVGFIVVADGGGTNYLRVGDSDGAPNVDINDSNLLTPTATTYYLEIIHNSSTEAVFNIYSDSNYSTLLATNTHTIPSTVTGLQYIKINNNNNSSISGGSLNGTIDDLKFYNGVTVVENIPSQQTATFEDDFTSDNWTDSDSTIIGVNTSTQVLDFKEKDGNFNETSYISQTIGDKFVYRMKFNLSTITQTGNADSVRTTFALSNAGDIPLTTARDEVGITMRVSNTYNKFYAFTSDGAQIPWGGTDFSFTPATSTDYYLEIIGNEGTYTFNIYSDEYSTLIESESITDAGLVLDKLVVRTATSTTTNNQAQGTIDDVKFYNNILEVNPATLTDYPLTIKIQGDADLKEKTTETFEELGDWANQTVADAAWTRNDTVNNFARANSPTADVINYTQDSDGSNDNIVNDLTSVSDTKWRCDLDVKLTQASSYPELWFGLMTGDESVAANSGTQDFIAIKFTSSAAIGLDSTSLHYGDGVILESATNAGTITDPWAVGQTKYLSLIRLSDTKILLQMFADKSRTISKGSVIGTIPSTIASLQYIKMSNRVVSNATSATLEVSNIRFWNNITNPVTQETATFEDDFTSSGATSHTSSPSTVGGWLANDHTKMLVNGSTDVADWDSSDIGSNNTMSYDLGAGNVDDEKWVLRCKFTIDNWTVGSSGNSSLLYFGLRDEDSSNNSQSSTQESIVWSVRAHPTGSIEKFYTTMAENEVLSNNFIAMSTTPTATTYYMELIRLNSTTARCTIYSDVNYSVVTETVDFTVDATITNLRYISIINQDSSASADHTLDGTIDDISFWNGITSPNAEGRKIVFTDDAFAGDSVEYASETVSYDPINGDLEAVVRIPTLTTGADTTIQMYYDYAATNPSYVPELFTSMPTADSVFGVNGDQVIEDCTTYTNTTEGDADYVPSVTGTNECRLNPSTNVIDCRFEDASPDHFVTYRDLTGATITDNAWTLRCKVATTVITAPSGGLSHSVFIGMSSNTSNFASSQDFLGISFWNPGASASPNTAKHYAVYRDGTIGGTSTQVPAASSVAFTTAWTNSDTYYIEIIRVSDTKLTVELFSDSAYTTSVEKQTVIVPSTVTALRYFKAGVYDNANVVGFTMTIDDLEFWEGVNKNREQSTYDTNYKAVYNLHGNSLDSTVYGNDGTDTAVDYEQQNNSVGLVANGTTTQINFGDQPEHDNIFAGGGTISFTFNANSDGESSAGRIYQKNGESFFRVERESGGLMGFDFVHYFSGSDGSWHGIVGIPINEINIVTIKYNSDSVVNNPIVIINGITWSVENGMIDESSTPTGTASTGSDLEFATDPSNVATFDGLIDNVKLSDESRPSSHAITSYNAEKSDSDIITAGDENTQ